MTHEEPMKGCIWVKICKKEKDQLFLSKKKTEDSNYINIIIFIIFVQLFQYFRAQGIQSIIHRNI